MKSLLIKFRDWFRDLPLHLKIFWLIAAFSLGDGAASGNPENLLTSVIAVAIIGFFWLMAIGAARWVIGRARGAGQILGFFTSTNKSAREDRQAERGSTHVHGDQLSRMIEREEHK